MIDPPWLPWILPEILKFRFSLHMIKDDWLTAQVLTRNPPLSLHIAHDSHQKFQSWDLVCTWSKMIDPAPFRLPRIPPEILKLRFSLHMVKDD